MVHPLCPLCPLTVALWLIVWFPASAAAEEPRELIERVARSVQSGSAASVRSGASAVVAALDLGEIAERTLGAHRGTLSDQQVEAYRRVLGEFAYATALSHLANLQPFVLDCKENTRGDRAEVRCVFTVGDERHAVTFFLRRKGEWRVYDVHTSRMRLLADNGRNIDRYIRRDGFDRLLRRMRRKLGEARARRAALR